MHETEALELRARAVGDQVVTKLYRNQDSIVRVSSTPPDMWTPEDIDIVRLCLLAVAGFLYEGRI